MPTPNRCRLSRQKQPVRSAPPPQTPPEGTQSAQSSETVTPRSEGANNQDER